MKQIRCLQCTVNHTPAHEAPCDPVLVILSAGAAGQQQCGGYVDLRHATSHSLALHHSTIVIMLLRHFVEPLRRRRETA
jgi:hypothetical protein